MRPTRAQKRNAPKPDVHDVNRAFDNYDNAVTKRFGAGVDAALRGFYAMYVLPLEERVAYLELPWWKKLERRIRGGVS